MPVLMTRYSSVSSSTTVGSGEIGFTFTIPWMFVFAFLPVGIHARGFLDRVGIRKTFALPAVPGFIPQCQNSKQAGGRRVDNP